LKPSLLLEPQRNPSKYKTETIEAPIIYGRKKRVNEIPELKIAIISVSFEVNQITDKNKKYRKRERKINRKIIVVQRNI
jgi:hypothetical protein